MKQQVAPIAMAGDASAGAPGPDADLRGVVFDIQRFSVHDGPGIRTTVFLKGCPLRCQWCQNPESFQRKPELAFFDDRCALPCHRVDGGSVTCDAPCVVACPKNALRLTDAGQSLELDRGRCRACGACTPACGYGALEVAGQSMSVDQVLARVCPDLPFYQASGGGVTLSGGEPMQQPEFVAALTAACTRCGINVGLQTSGAFAAPDLEPILDQLAFIHYDLKIMDKALHRALVGAHNSAILRNARDLIKRKAPVEFRRLIVPGLNDDADELARLASFLHELGQPRISLLQFHPMGDVKRSRLGLPGPADRPGTAQAQAAVKRARQHLQTLGIEVST